jgi:hypothetical protein
MTSITSNKGTCERVARNSVTANKITPIPVPQWMQSIVLVRSPKWASPLASFFHYLILVSRDFKNVINLKISDLEEVEFKK